METASNLELDYALPGARLMRVQRARGWILDCQQGEVFLTQQGDSRDFILRAGERVQLGTQGRVLLEAVAGEKGADARVRLLKPRPCAFPLSRPVVRLLAARTLGDQGRPPLAKSTARPFTYTEVFLDPRLFESLVRAARQERNAFLVACVAKVLLAIRRAPASLLPRAGSAGRRGLNGLARAIASLRLQLPSAHETFTALLFLRSRL